MVQQTREERAAYMQVYREAHKEKAAAYNRAWNIAHQAERRAYNCAYHAIHSEESHTRNRIWRETHQQARKDYNRIWCETHQAEKTAHDRAYRKAHREEYTENWRRRKARLIGAMIGKIDIGAIQLRDRMLCCICGKKVAKKDFSLDHVVPLALGGAHSQTNLRVAHLHCNIRRGAGRLPAQMVMC